MGEKGVVVGRVGLHVKSDDLLTPAHDNLFGALGQLQGLGSSPSLFAGVTLALHLIILSRKEPLGFFAAHSPASMIIPINFTGHIILQARALVLILNRPSLAALR